MYFLAFWWRWATETWCRCIVLTRFNCYFLKTNPSKSEMPRIFCESILLNYLLLLLNFKLKCLISPSISLAWFTAIKFPRKRKGLAGNLEITHWYAGPPAENPILRYLRCHLVCWFTLWSDSHYLTITLKGKLRIILSQ